MTEGKVLNSYTLRFGVGIYAPNADKLVNALSKEFRVLRMSDLVVIKGHCIAGFLTIAPFERSVTIANVYYFSKREIRERCKRRNEEACKAYLNWVMDFIKKKYVRTYTEDKPEVYENDEEIVIIDYPNFDSCGYGIDEPSFADLFKNFEHRSIIKEGDVRPLGNSEVVGKCYSIVEVFVGNVLNGRICITIQAEDDYKDGIDTLERLLKILREEGCTYSFDPELLRPM